MNEKIGWDGKYILRKVIPHTWLKVVGTIMNYITLDTDDLGQGIPLGNPKSNVLE